MWNSGVFIIFTLFLRQLLFVPYEELDQKTTTCSMVDNVMTIITSQCFISLQSEVVCFSTAERILYSQIFL